MKFDYDYSLLLDEIEKKYGTQENFANAMGMLPSALSNKLSNENRFTQDQMEKAISLLGLSGARAHKCFFTHKVQKNLT